MGLIEVKTYTSAAEMLSSYADLKKRFYPPRPAPKPEIVAIEKPRNSGNDVWLAMTTEERCKALEQAWRVGDTMRLTADRLSRMIGRLVTRETIGTLHKKHRDGLLSGVRYGVKTFHKQWLEMVEGIEPTSDDPMEYMAKLCEAAELDVDQVLSSSYRREDVSSRRAFMYLVCKHLPDLPRSRIALALNTYDSTLRLAVDAVEKELAND